MEINRQHYRHQVGALPLVKHILKRLNLKDILCAHVANHANEIIPAIDSLLILVYNLAIGKIPLYKLSKWIDSIDLRYLGYENSQSLQFNDYRFGRVLDKLYKTDRASLMTEIVLSSIKNFEIDLDQIHNDSTSVKAYGKIPGKTKMGLELLRGHSKDHRPDLKQLIFNLTISMDGGVPIHCKTYSGNRTDDTIHIETWDYLLKLCRKADFLYVADSKLCTDDQLNHITSHGGRAITIVPNTWGETQAFKDKLRKTKIAKTEIWRRTKPGTLEDIEYFSVYKGDYFTEQRGYRLHWICSSEKRNRDRDSRNQRLQKAEKELAELIGKLNTKKYKNKEAILSKADEILEKHDVKQFVDIQLGTTKSREVRQLGKGRPGPQTEYEEVFEELFTLYWMRNSTAIKEEMNLDGVFPLLSTDTTLSSEEVLKAYKYQPKIEKRFSQFKSIHNAAPLLFKNIERVESNMFVFFMSLMLQALIEREIQNAMKEKNIASIDVYPEQRRCKKPTANVIFELFEPMSTYEIKDGSRVIEAYHDKLDETQKIVLKLLGMKESEYWNYAA
jgi:transposase